MNRWATIGRPAGTRAPGARGSRSEAAWPREARVPAPLRGVLHRDTFPRVAHRRAAPRRRSTRGYNPQPRWGQKPRQTSPRSGIDLRPEGAPACSHGWSAAQPVGRVKRSATRGREVAQRNPSKRWRFSVAAPEGQRPSRVDISPNALPNRRRFTPLGLHQQPQEASALGSRSEAAQPRAAIAGELVQRVASLLRHWFKNH
jgi:hypothetical protein